jgi:HEAT repeat protein
MAITVQDTENMMIDAISIMNTAIINLRLYPPTNVMIDRTLDRLLLALTTILVEKDPLVLAESERTLLFDNNPVRSKNQEKAHIRALVELFVDGEIKSISFESGLEKEELTAFLQVLSRTPDEIRREGGIRELLAHREIPHIRIDEKVYLARNVTEENLTEFKDDIVAFLMGVTDTETPEFQQLRMNAKDPGWINGVFDTWRARLKERQGVVPNAQLANDMIRMARMMEKIVDPADMDRTVHLMSRSVAEMEIDAIKTVLTQEIKGCFDGRFLEEIINTLSEDQFVAIVDDLALGSASPDRDGQRATISLTDVMNTDRGRKLAHERETRMSREEKEKEKRFGEIKGRVLGLLNGEEAAFLDRLLMADLPGFIGELHALGKGDIADRIIENVVDKLRSPDTELRFCAAESLSQALHELITDGRGDSSQPLAERLAGWLRSETTFSFAGERICRQLIEAERAILSRDPFAVSNPILDALNSIQSGKYSNDSNARALGVDAVSGLATDDLLNTLFHEFQTNEHGRRDGAAKNLGRLGIAPLQRLLDLLRESEDNDERARILQSIYEIGAPAVPAITARMKADEPWYFLRNLAYAFGRVGGEAQVADLTPLLLHENQKVQQEVIKSLQRIGGTARAAVLLSVLPKADEQLKMLIIEMLGTIRAPEAVSPLIAILRSKPAVVSSPKADIDEKICIALGNIGSEEALPALREVIKSKGFFIVRAYPEKVRVAADKAIAAISKRKP